MEFWAGSFSPSGSSPRCCTATSPRASPDARLQAASSFRTALVAGLAGLAALGSLATAARTYRLYDRARHNLDRAATYAVAAYLAGATSSE